MTIILVKGRAGVCPQCGDAPIQHIGDGYGGHTCLTCIARANLRKQGNILPGYSGICTMGFGFKLSLREREQASRASKDAYPMHTVCIECGMEWCQHTGYLCPSGDSTFIPLLECDMPLLRRSDVED
jgi:hypothetical protein